MRRIRDLGALLLMASIGMAGCSTSENQIRPPKPPEEFREPPANDPRYSGPVQYPAETMDQDILLKRAKESSKPNPGSMNMRGAGRPGTGGLGPN